MLEYTKIAHHMEITAAGGNTLHGTAQGIVLVVVRGACGVLRTVKSPIVLMLNLNNNIFFTLVPAQKSLKTVIEKVVSRPWTV